jgi:predicted NBD/HSP70 family sugar kinase
VQDALNSMTTQHGQLLGIGIGVAGVIDSQRGIVHYSPYFGWRDVSLAQMLQDKLNVPVYIENDVNTLTISEQLFGAGRHQQNFIVVTIGRGIGMGIVINHQLYRGSKGAGGELGHIVVMPDGPQCSCGKRGCLEAIAADPAVVHYVQERLPNNARALNTLGNILAAAQAGNAVCREALARSGEYFGIALSTMLNVLNPSLCILSGEGVTAGDFRLNPMRDALKKHTFNDMLDNTEFVIEPADDRLWARGAASLVISKVFESPLAEGQLASQ